MTKRIFTTGGQSWTTQGVTAALTSTTYMGIQGSTATTQMCDILEILISGMATSSTVGAFEFAAVSTVATGITALVAPSHDFPLNQYGSQTNLMTTYTTATTAGPQVSSGTGTPAIQLGLNMFGGIIRWNAAPTQQLTMFGAGANSGSFVLYNASVAGGATGSANAHIIYEAY